VWEVNVSFRLQAIKERMWSSYSLELIYF
jgi:hypothetical protein